MRSNRVRSLLGLHDVPGDGKDDVNRPGNAINGGDGALNSSSRDRGRTGNVPDNSNAAANQTGSQQVGGSNRSRGVATTLAEEMMIDTEAAVMANFDFLSSEVEVDDDEEMGDDGDDGYNPDIKLKGASDVLDQVDKDTEEVLDFNFVPGSESGVGKDSVDSVDGVKGDFDDFDDNATNHQERSGEWGEKIQPKNWFVLLCKIQQILINNFVI